MLICTVYKLLAITDVYILLQIPRHAHLNNLCQTCKIWNAIVLPRLYAHLKITISSDSPCLLFLETLAGSAGDGLKLTTGMSVATRPGIRDYTGLIPDQDPARSVCLPEQQVSDALNILVRVILERIPRQRLLSFA